MALGVGDGSALSVVGSGGVCASGGMAVALGVGDGSAVSVVGSGGVCASGGTAVALGVGDGSALSVVGSGGVCASGGTALSVVGSGGVCPEDALLSGSLVARSEDSPSAGSSEPPQASSSNGRSSARAKIPRKRSWRSHLASLTVFAGPRWGRRQPNPSTRRGIACLRTPVQCRVNDPAGLPAWRFRFDFAGAGDWLCPVGAPMAKNTRPGGGPKPHSSGRGVIPFERNVVAFGRQQLADGVRSHPRVTSGGQKTGFANRDFVVWTSGGNANVSSVVGRVKPMSKARDNRELYRILPKQKRPSTRSTGSLALDSHR